MAKKQKSKFEFKRVWLIVLGLVVVGGSYYAWNYQNEMKVMDKVSVRLKWLHQSQFAGHYVADQKGYYKDAGIEVELLSFDYVKYPIEEVVEGRAEFGVAGADEVLMAIASDEPIKVVAVIYQQSPVVAYTLASSGIKSPADFVGKTIGMQTGNVESIVRSMMASQNIDYRDVNEVPIEFDVNVLLDGEVDIATGYLTNEPIQVEERGYPVTVINPADYGVSLYADVLFTTNEMIESNPELVHGFVRATLEGWEYALENIDEAVEYTLMYEDPNNEVMNAKHQKALLENSVALIKPKTVQEIGDMNYLAWRNTLQIVSDYQDLEKELDLREVYTRVFLENNQ